MMKEYIVTCKTKEDLQSLYDDLETPGGNLYIPDRCVELVSRRPLSRNTHYRLTEEEAELIKNDPRVLDVSLNPSEFGVKIKPQYTITTNNWSKSTFNADTVRAWAMYRCTNEQTVTNWGANGTRSISGTVLFTSTGKNVDVVVVDGCLDPAHPEFAINESGSGLTRVNQFNWFSLNTNVTGDPNGTYLYTDGDLGDYTTNTVVNGVAQVTDNNHGNHVAGTLAGNRRGWAREANIFNINPYATAPSTISNTILIDYIREWHNTKSANATTGKKNPSITNHSYGSFIDISISDVNYIIYRGTQINNPTAQQCTNSGLVNNGTTILDVPVYSSAVETDIEDAIDDGIIFVAAAGNNSFKIDVEGGEDYDNIINWEYTNPNTLEVSTVSVYYNRGTSPGATSRVITVGAIDANVVEQKATFSACGPGVDVYAPGVNIQSSALTGGVNDGRNSLYRILKDNGTSFASPNVSGIIACLAEHWPRITQDEIRSYFNCDNNQGKTYLATTNQLTDGTGTRSLQGSANRYLVNPKIRRVPNPTGTTYIGGAVGSQITFPKNNKFRSILTDGSVNTDVYNSGFVYPRHPIWHRSLT